MTWFHSISYLANNAALPFSGRVALGVVATLASTVLVSCNSSTTNNYEATAQTTYTWQVEYLDQSDRKQLPRVEAFASTSLENRNGQRPDDAVTGPDDKGLWWPALPPEPTVDEIEDRRQNTSETLSSPLLQKSVQYSVTLDVDGQRRTLPTDYSVYRQVVKAYPNQEPLLFTLGVNDGSVEKAEPAP